MTNEKQNWEEEFELKEIKQILDLFLQKNNTPMSQKGIEWESDFRSHLLEAIRQTLTRQAEEIEEAVEKFIDDNDDGLWSGRETADNILLAIKKIIDK